MPAKKAYTLMLGTNALSNCRLTTKRDALRTARFLKQFHPNEDLWVANEPARWTRVYTATLSPSFTASTGKRTRFVRSLGVELR